MRLLHFLEIENFKRFGGRQRIELDHPTVLIGPNNCGKTSAIQALALWSQAVKTWHGSRGSSTARERTSTPLNRLSIVAVPVNRTRYFWHNTRVRAGATEVRLTISVGVYWKGEVVPLTMRFRNLGEELVYCTPDETALADLPLIEYAASLNVHLLYSMSGLEIEEPVLQPGRIDVLLGQGQTAQVLRNLCHIVLRESREDWERITGWIHRLFGVELGAPAENARGSIDLRYRQPGVTEELDISQGGRGFHQMLLLLAYLYSHPGSVVLVDEPDAHLEILRQKQVYVLLREIAAENQSQVILVTHSEVVLQEALDRNVTLLVEGRAASLTGPADAVNALKHYGAEHYVKARERGYVLYVEGSTDLDMLEALAACLEHPVAAIWDSRVNSFYVQDNYPLSDVDKELERVEGGFGIPHNKHFYALRSLLPDLRGLAILDSDTSTRADTDQGGLRVLYWKRYETENYFISPEVLEQFAREEYARAELAGQYDSEIQAVLEATILELIFDGSEADFNTYRESPPAAARLIWGAQTARRKLSTFAEEFFRRLAARLGHPMLLRKGELHRLVALVDPAAIPAEEVRQKLDALEALFKSAEPGEGAAPTGGARQD
ncbi:MAG: AAA family ATPase [Actinomycetota bacterium]